MLTDEAEWGFCIAHPKLTVEKPLVEMFLQNVFLPPSHTECHPSWLLTPSPLIPSLRHNKSLFIEVLRPDSIPNPSTLNILSKKEGPRDSPISC